MTVGSWHTVRASERAPRARKGNVLLFLSARRAREPSPSTRQTGAGPARSADPELLCSLWDMTDEVDGAKVRLAELAASLSLGIDLGFGQPMEHVLRQCLIALRLAERIGLDEQERAVVYYTSLLVNVG